eukprot:TRINITY_DN24_c0_g1_i3.p1 TRINITY_DN24_c0_g1~~TRINITY_DN24_c0_g1_i3.p1  ORF type:complete len:240 (-),score=52.01 TRINITY_DN24_c0_g1_i3:340-1059(-)
MASTSFVSSPAALKSASASFAGTSLSLEKSRACQFGSIRSALPCITAVYVSPNGAVASIAPIADKVKLLQSKPLAELKAIARMRGIHANTKAQLVKLLSAQDNRPSSQAASPVASLPATAPAASLTAADLQRKSLAELRGIARQKGLRGDTKGEIISLLLKSQGAPSTALAGAVSPAAVAAQSFAFSVAPAASPAAVTAGAEHARQLRTKPLALLRAMAASRGIRATTKEELIRVLSRL